MTSVRGMVFRTLTCRLVAAAAFSIATIGSLRLGIAQSLGFVPGDAFFVVALDEASVKSLSDHGEAINLSYLVPSVDFGNLYAGFARIRIEGKRTRFAGHLRRVYYDYRYYIRKIVRKDTMSDGSLRDTEMNAPLAFVYNRDTDWSEQGIGLKYNEDWPHLPAGAFEGTKREVASGQDSHAEYYQPLLRDYHAVVTDWGSAHRFKGLKVQVPKGFAWGKWGTLVNEPVVAQADDVQVIVTNPDDLEDCFLRKPNASFYQVTRDGVKVCRWREGDTGVELVTKRLSERKGVQNAGGERKANEKGSGERKGANEKASGRQGSK